MVEWNGDGAVLVRRLRASGRGVCLWFGWPRVLLVCVFSFLRMKDEVLDFRMKCLISVCFFPRKNVDCVDCIGSSPGTVDDVRQFEERHLQ